jgi:uncharacterized protein
MAMQLITVRIDKPEATNFILGQTHFIKSVEDIHEALVGAVPGIKFGLAFCEASGKCLVRTSGTDAAMVELAARNATALAAGHCFIVFLGDGFFPVNILNALKMVPEVCRIICATANPTEVVVAETDQGRGLLGVIDGFPPKGVEGKEDVKWRKNFLRQIGYKLWGDPSPAAPGKVADGRMGCGPASRRRARRTDVAVPGVTALCFPHPIRSASPPTFPADAEKGERYDRSPRIYVRAANCGRNLRTAHTPSATKANSATAWVATNGGSDCVGANALRNGNFMNDCAISTKTFK